MPNPLTLLGDSLKALATSPRLSFSPSTSGTAPSSAWLGSFPASAKKDYGALVGDPLHNYVIAAAVNAVALALPDAPPYLENLQDGRWVRVDDHPVLSFLRQPHEDLDDAEVWSLTSLYRLTPGEAFWVIHLSDAGLPAEAVPTDPRRVRVIGTRDELISGYEITTEDGRLLPFPKQQVLHFRHLPDPANPRRGWTPLSTGARHLVGSNAASTYHTALLLNGAVSSWLISIRDSGQANITPEQFQTFIDAMRRKYAGTTESAGGIDGLSIPLDIQRMAYSPDEMAIDKLVNYYEQTLCSLTGVSKKLLDLGADATYLNLREAISDFWERRLVPMRNKDARSLTNQLLPMFGLSPSQWRISFDFSNVPALQENQDALFTRWRDLFKAGGCDLYTLQTKIGLPSVPEEYKDRFFNTPPKQTDDEAPDNLEAKAIWREADHPRNYHGMFESGSGGGSPTAQSPSAFEDLHTWQGDALGEVESAAFQQGKAKAIQRLLPYAKPGNVEAAVVVIKGDGSHYKFATGTPDEVDITAPSTKVVALLHTHPGDYAHSFEDWTTFVSSPNIGQSHVVTPTKTYSLHKPEGWTAESYGLETPRPSDIVGEEEAAVERNASAVAATFGQAMRDEFSRLGGTWSPRNEELARHNANQALASQYGIKFRIGSRN